MNFKDERKMTLRRLVVFSPLIFLTACISAEHSTEQLEKKEPEVYVFDDFKNNDEIKLDSVTTNTPSIEKFSVPQKTDTVPSNSFNMIKKYTIQLGAFTTKERADAFIKENQDKTSLIMKIYFNANTKLFSVQVPPFKTKEEADIIRDNLRKFPVFKDSFTLIVEN